MENNFNISAWKGELLGEPESFLSFRLVFRRPTAEDLILDQRPNSEERVQGFVERVVCALAANDSRVLLVHLAEILHFLQKHEELIFLVPNVELDTIVILKLPQDDEVLGETWLEKINGGRVRDPLILDALVRLALDDENTILRKLGDLVQEYSPSEVPLSCERVIVTAASTPEETDLIRLLEPLSTYLPRLVPIYKNLLEKASLLMKIHEKEFYSTAPALYGHLSEIIQVKASVVLLQVELNGMAIDVSRAASLKVGLQAQLAEALQKLTMDPEYRQIFRFKLDSQGKEIFEVDGENRNKPSINQEKLFALLESIVEKIQQENDLVIYIPRTEKGTKLSTQRKIWLEFEKYHPFIKLWLQMESAAHFLAFLAHIDETGHVHPEYQVFVRNGRTSCKNPPIQQTPRSGGYRELFVASPGHVLVAVDYKFIELCTLAAICEFRYGRSVLADVIRQGRDPHAFTAAMFEKVPLEVFMSWKTSTDPETAKRFATRRQQAKAINFGIPSGLTASGLGEYAKSSYQIELSMEEAERFRLELVEIVYPELGKYLDDVEMKTLAHNLGCSEGQIYRKFSFPGSDKTSPEKRRDRLAGIAGGVRNVIKGKTNRKDGTQYRPQFVSKVWRGLQELVQDPSMLREIQSSQELGSPELFRKLLGKDVVTLSGRIRGKVGFTQACNTPFSGLAADGGKLALWNLFQIGFRIVAFIHDEILVELSEDADLDEEVELIRHVVCGSMQELTGTVPIDCEITLSRVWSKAAKLVRDAQGHLVVWEA